MSHVRLIMLVVSTLSVMSTASACPDGVEWYAALPVDNPRVVEATITYSGSQALYDVHFEVTYFAGPSELGRRSHQFPGEVLEGRRAAKVEHGYSAATTATGGNLSFKCKQVGATPRLTEPPQVHKVAAQAVPRANGRGSAGPGGRGDGHPALMSDITGNWANQDPTLGFIQFLDVEKTDPTTFRVTVWLRCPRGQTWTTRQRCSARWGPRLFRLQADGQLPIDEPGDNVGRNVLSLEGDTLKVTTPSTGWVNYFRRVQ